MKKVFIILTLLVTSMLFSQDRITMDGQLEPYLIEFINEGLEREVDVSSYILKNVDSLLFEPNYKFPLFGMQSNNKTIKIASFCAIDPIILRAVVFHELTHVFLPEHYCDECEDLMSANAPRSFYIYSNNQYWEEQLDKIFKRIKQSRNK